MYDYHTYILKPLQNINKLSTIPGLKVDKPRRVSTMDITINRYREIWYNFYRWQHELNTIYKFSLAISFALLTGLLAQFRFYLPLSPVPITGQTFAVLLAGVLLGRWGGVSLGLYVGLGAMGIPWFASISSGLYYLLGPTGGYLIGFIFASFFLGYMIDKHLWSHSFHGILGLMFLANFLLIYIPGLIVLYLWTGGTSIVSLLTIGLLPFIPGDITKIIAASTIAYSILPREMIE